jgi:hypothetical protein
MTKLSSILVELSKRQLTEGVSIDTSKADPTDIALLVAEIGLKEVYRKDNSEPEEVISDASAEALDFLLQVKEALIGLDDKDYEKLQGFKK